MKQQAGVNLTAAKRYFTHVTEGHIFKTNYHELDSSTRMVRYPRALVSTQSRAKQSLEVFLGLPHVYKESPKASALNVKARNEEFFILTPSPKWSTFYSATKATLGSRYKALHHSVRRSWKVYTSRANSTWPFLVTATRRVYRRSPSMSSKPQT